MRAAYLIITILLLSFATLSQAATLSPRLEAALQGLTVTDQVDVIVRMRNRVNLKNFDKANRKYKRPVYRARLLRELKSRHYSEQTALKSKINWLSKKEIKPLWLLNGFALNLSVTQIVELSQNPRIESIDLDAIVTLAEPIPTTQSPPQWNINMVQAPVLWSYGYSGQGIVVASMDTGVDIYHPDLAASWRGGTNSWFDPNGEHVDLPYDKTGHGTGSMGVIVGGNFGGTTIGVAPDAQWIAVKIFKDDDTTTNSAIHQGFQWLMDPDGNPNTDDAPDVVNNSWGYQDNPGSCITEFEPDVQLLKQAGIAVIFSAGNAGPTDPVNGPFSTALSPANYADSFAVGAVDQYVNLASFSSRGPSTCTPSSPFPNVVAPGVSIKTADLTSEGVIPNSYAYLNGTSFAAPHVTGAIALLKSAYPAATVSELEAAINNSAIDILSPGLDDESGYGLLDILGALYTLPVDTDGDGIYDGADNCVLVSNTDQIDTDGDGFGNICDADLNNDNVVNVLDFNIFRTVFLTSDPNSDFDGNGVVNVFDFNIFRQLFLKTPGPSGLVH